MDMKKLGKWSLLMLLGIFLITTQTLAAEISNSSLEQTLETFRQRYNLPALAAAVVQGEQIVATAAVGLRKQGTDVLVTVNDVFHIGSCTKSMTALLAAWLVEQGKISWGTTIAEVFPDLEKIHPDYRDMTLEQLLSHTGGAPDDSKNNTAKWIREVLTHKTLSLQEQRLLAAEKVVAKAPQAKPGTKVIYSNAGYVIIGAMLERVAGESWESLMKRIVFDSVGMTSAGFGTPASPGAIDQPWGHHTTAPKGFRMRNNVKCYQ
jgi:CubicO group peptidase (beta-lactamase class C family)